MLNIYARAVGNGWPASSEMEALARYVRAECGSGTRVDFLLAEAGAAAPRADGGPSRGLIEAVRAVARGLRPKRAPVVSGGTAHAPPTDG